jgi:DNA-binding transcriptional regulator YiaG
MPRPQFEPRHPPATPQQIKAKRGDLSMPAAAKICSVNVASWEAWEAGRYRMPAPVWRLFNILLDNPELQDED